MQTFKNKLLNNIKIKNKNIKIKQIYKLNYKNYKKKRKKKIYKCHIMMSNHFKGQL